MDDVYAACDALEPLGYGFKKKPDEGEFQRFLRSCGCHGLVVLWMLTNRVRPRIRRIVCCVAGGMKGLAFAYDPDGYWVEILSSRGLRDLILGAD